MSLPQRNIGNTLVSAIGYGCMGLSAYYGKPLPDEERFKVLDAAYENGCTMWDTANAYMDSEELLGKWFKRTGKRNEIFLATKFGLVWEQGRPVNGDPEYVPKALEASLKSLGVDYIDLYYLHRADPTVPIELTVGAMAELVKAGKVKHLGLSEVSAETLRRAHAVHPISAVQVEYSPFVLDIEEEKIGLLKAARELGVTVVAYSPLGRGFLTGKIRSPNDLAEDDGRRAFPMASKENFPNVLKVADSIKTIADRHGATAGQVSLAWLLAQGSDIIPIPGTTKIPSLKENIAAAKLTLSPAEIEEVRAIAEKASAWKAPRLPPAFAGLAALLFADTPPLPK